MQAGEELWEAAASPERLCLRLGEARGSLCLTAPQSPHPTALLAAPTPPGMADHGICEPQRPLLAAEFPGAGTTRSSAELGGLPRDPAVSARQCVGLIGPAHRGC